MVDSKPTKRRALRIPLEFHKRLDSAERWQVYLSIAVIVPIGFWLAANCLSGIGGREQYSPGPLANVHMRADGRSIECLECHVSGHALRPDAVHVWTVSSADKWTRPTDQKCRDCHQVHEHSPHETASTVGSCASCHTDHHGHDFSLTRLDDVACTQCHADLGRFTVATHQPGIAPSITAFSAEHHPEFRSLGKDPGHIKFSHARHLALGLRLPGERVGMAMTLGDIPGSRERYQVAGQLDGDLVQLECNSCHNLNGTEIRPSRDAAARGTELPPSSSARYMRTVCYEDHCRACHPLRIESASGQEIEHGLQPPAIQKFLTSVFTNPTPASPTAAGQSVRRPLPGRPERAADQSTVQDSETTRVTNAQRNLARRCSQCHEFQAAADQGFLPDVEPSKIPAKWLEHALFSHAAHLNKKIKCAECHGPADGSEHNSDVLIPNREMCLTCHTPDASGPLSARHDCGECHRYHGGGNPLYTLRLDDGCPQLGAAK